MKKKIKLSINIYWLIGLFIYIIIADNIILYEIRKEARIIKWKMYFVTKDEYESSIFVKSRWWDNLYFVGHFRYQLGKSFYLDSIAVVNYKKENSKPVYIYINKIKNNISPNYKGVWIEKNIKKIHLRLINGNKKKLINNLYNKAYKKFIEEIIIGGER